MLHNLVNQNECMQTSKAHFYQIELCIVKLNVVSCLAEMEKYPNIEDFRCGENLITSISRGVFSRNGYLTSLSLDSNAISQIVPGAFQGMHLPLKRLATKYLGRNQSSTKVA